MMCKLIEMSKYYSIAKFNAKWKRNLKNRERLECSVTIMVLTQFVVDGQWRNVSDQPYCESFIGGYR